MANHSKYGNSYRGRNSAWKPLLAVFLLLIIAVSVGFLLLQDHIIYDEDGRLYLDFLPERPAPGGTGSAPGPEIPPEDMTIIIERPDPKEEEKRYFVYELAHMPLTDWAAHAAELPADEVTPDAVCITVKDGEGYVYVDSVAAAALGRRSVVVKDTTEQAIADMTAEEAPAAIARICCLRDPRAAIIDVRGLGLRQRTGYLFYDESGASWLDPAKDAVRKYLTGLAGECARMGFDELLLTDLCYPSDGKLETINYGDVPKNENLAAFLKEMRAAVADEEVRLSVEVPAEVILNGSSETMGLVLTELAELVDGIYVRTAAAEAPQLAELVKAANPDIRFVAEVTDAERIATDYLLLYE